ncbi:hypothetical protein TELCIR_12612 [Teladorsagia circumcincta]|uniref:Uncharacterized protein n=1 Tax=Teladorsagia circumcincta TaxID=45464 RepID=A0A2G9U7M9_TELCI|nr:hypothetical protein TELCIR_12612 [Teladorsagia circumcincta]
MSHFSPEDVSIFPQISLSDIRGKLFVLRDDLDFDWEPSGNAVLKVYNYWEPLHLLLFGKGLQTWEYSPVYAISLAEANTTL